MNDEPEPLTQEPCPRCGGAFHCGAADAVPCACTTIKLDAATLSELGQRYSSCLCLRCLASMSAASIGDPSDRACDGERK